MKPQTALASEPGRSNRLLDWIERTGNRLPDPAVHFLIALGIVWVVSALLSGMDFGITDPRTGEPLRIHSLITPAAITRSLESVVVTYTSFPPLGVVLVMALGVGVAEHSGLVGAALRRVLQVAPTRLLTPMLVAATVLGAVAGDATLLVMAPLGGAAFYAAGRHPLAGIIAGFGANMMLVASFAPTGIDLVMQGFTQRAAQMIYATREVNPLCNWAFAAAAGVVTTLAFWWVIDKVIEPRLRNTPVDGDPAELPQNHPLTPRDLRSLRRACVAGGAAILVLAFVCAPASSPLRAADGTLTGLGSPLMKALVPVLLLLILVPAIAYGYSSGSISSHKDVIRGMSKTMSSMGYYMVMVFFAAQFVRGFSESNLGALIALKGGLALKAMALPPLVTLFGLIGLTSLVNLMVASASAKWAMLAPIFVPMLMAAGISPEATQVAYRIGDSPTNMLTPLNPYFPLVVAFSAKYVRNTGIGTVISLSLPIALLCLVLLGAQLAVFWLLRMPLGIQGPFLYP